MPADRGTGEAELTPIPYPQDYHLHSDFSCDSETSMQALCEAAVARGIPEIGFTEHFDLDPDDECYASFHIDRWWAELERCRAMFADRLVVRAGVEVGEPHRWAPGVASALAGHPWDYWLGSLHRLESFHVFAPDSFPRTPGEAYSAYFEELARLAHEGDFEILAHLDIVKRYGFDRYGAFDPLDHEAEIREVLRACARRGLALEINSGLLRRPVRDTSPSPIVLRWFAEEGGCWVTLGSDAHRPEHVGFGFERALAAVREAGFEHLTRFVDRRPTALPLPAEGVA